MFDENAINAVAPCKSALTSFAFNCGPQQVNNIIFVKHKCMAAQIAGNQHT
jgi:GH24 family phage-related lysozyme (muramidase)